MVKEKRYGMDNHTTEYSGPSLRRAGPVDVAHIDGLGRPGSAGRVRPAGQSPYRPAILAGHVRLGVSGSNTLAFTRSSFYPLAVWQGFSERDPSRLGAQHCVCRPDTCASEPHRGFHSRHIACGNPNRSPISACHRTVPDHFGWGRGATISFDLAGGCVFALADRCGDHGRRVDRPRGGCLQTRR
jgi:hypothetical protein